MDIEVPTFYLSQILFLLTLLFARSLQKRPFVSAHWLASAPTHSGCEDVDLTVCMNVWTMLILLCFIPCFCSAHVIFMAAMSMITAKTPTLIQCQRSLLTAIRICITVLLLLLLLPLISLLRSTEAISSPSIPYLHVSTL